MIEEYGKYFYSTRPDGGIGPRDFPKPDEGLREDVELAVLSFATDFHRYENFRKDIATKGIKSHPCFVDQILTKVRQHYQNYVACVGLELCCDLEAKLEEAREQERLRVVSAISDELWKSRKMFDYEGKPTNEVSQCTCSVLSITSPRLAEIAHELRSKGVANGTAE